MMTLPAEASLHFQWMFDRDEGAYSGRFKRLPANVSCKPSTNCASPKFADCWRKPAASSPQVTNNCGFESLPDFHRQFRGIMKTAPGNYRHKHESIVAEKH